MSYLHYGRLLTRHRGLPWLVLLLGMTCAAGGTFLFASEVAKEEHALFRIAAIDKAREIDLRLRAYSDVLYSLRGLFDASDEMTREDFHHFAQAISLDERYPGLTSISFARLVPDELKASFERSVRAETTGLLKGLPAFSIHPPGKRAEYLPLHYIEPMRKNEAAWGLDLMADPQLGPAVERARDSGGISSISGVTLLRDGKAVVPSTLLRLALYRGGGVPGSESERRRLHTGAVGSTLRIGELVESTLKGDASVRVRIFSRAATPGETDLSTAEQLLYDSAPLHEKKSRADYSGYAVDQSLHVGDRDWRVVVMPLTDPASPFKKFMIAGVLTVTLAFALLLAWLVGSLAVTQRQRFDLTQRSRESTLMTLLGEELHSCQTVKEAYGVIVSRMPDLVPGTAAALYVYDAAHTHAAAVARWGSPDSASGEIGPNECRAIRRGQPNYVEDASRAPNCGHFAAQPPHCYVCVPLSAQGELIGVLHVRRCPGYAPASTLDETTLSIIKACAQHVALALANLALHEKLLERATRDNLTGLYNRHYMREWLDQELHRAARHRRSLGMIMIDVDHFKRVNDGFGHEAGDMVLREVAGILTRLARKSDVACRHGGEEFLLLMPETTLKGACAKAEEVRREVERAYEGRSPGPLTISAGVALYPDHATDAHALLRCADEALYAAKEGGRNRVCTSGVPATGLETAHPDDVACLS